MTIRHLKVFVAVCECGGMTKAAEMMHLAQPAVSRTISDIEEYYNIILFNRISQRVVLTETGKEFLYRAKETVKIFDDFENFARSSVDKPNIHIGASLTIGKSYLPKIMRYIKDTYPNIKLHTTVNNAKEIQNGIIDGEIDFAIIENSLLLPNIKAEKFLTDSLSVVCGYDYDIPSSVTVNELSKTDLLLRERGSSSRNHLETVFNLNGISCSPAMESISNQAIISAVIENFGVAVLPEALVRPYILKKKLREIELKGVKLLRQSYVISHKNKKFGRTLSEIYNYCCNFSGS